MSENAVSHRLIRPLEGYRALAILAVLLFHLDKHLLPGGYLGVDLFFVISGFIITKGLVNSKAKDTLRLGEFYKKRFRRLFPALMVTTLVTLAGAWLVTSSDGFATTAKSAIFSVFSLANINFWLDSGYFAAESSAKPLLHMWSLSVEEQFYLFWPFVILLLAPRISKIMAVLLFILSFLATIYMSIKSPETAFFWFPFRVYEFMGGAILSLYAIKIKQNGLATASLIIGVIAFLAACIIFDENSNIAMAGGLTVLACVALLLSMESQLGEVLFGNRVMVWIGQHSYSIYLVHWPLIVLYTLKNGSLSIVEIIFLGFAAIVLGALLKWLIEDPFRQSKNKRSLPARWAFPPVILTTLFTVCVASIVWVNKGFPGRIDGSLETLLKRGNGFTEHMKTGTCFITQNQDLSIMPETCYVPEEGKRNLLIIGSSLAGDLRRGFDVSFPDWGVKQITGGGCPPLRAKHKRQTCTDIRNLIFKDVLLNYDYDLVVLSGFHARGVAGIQQAEDYLNELGVDYVIIGPRPKFEIDPRTLITNHGTMDGLDRKMKDNLNPLPELTISNPDIRYFSANDALCEKENECVWQIDGQLAYRDGNHLLPIGSEYLGRKFAAWYEKRPKAK